MIKEALELVETTPSATRRDGTLRELRGEEAQWQPRSESANSGPKQRLFWMETCRDLRVLFCPLFLLVVELGDC